MTASKFTKPAVVVTAAAAATMYFSAAAHACGGQDATTHVLRTFQSPSGNIACDYQLGFDDDPTKGYVSCEVRDHTWVAPRETDCTGPIADEQRARGLQPNGDTFSMRGGEPAKMMCYWGVGSLSAPNKTTLDYGQTLSVGTITCESEASGVTCTDAGTGHFFRISREAYEVG
jgi:hypothetical protein